MLNLLFPPRCPLCKTQGTRLCRTCARTLPPAPDLGCPPGLASCASLFAYEGTTRDLIGAVKFDNHRDSLPVLGSMLALLVDAEVDMVTWAPTSAARRRSRGFDQAELLARQVAKNLGSRCVETLQRNAGRSQTGHGRAERLVGPQFRARGRLSGVVLLIDDVRTTGATLCAAADCLTEAGADAVHGATLAVTL